MGKENKNTDNEIEEVEAIDYAALQESCPHDKYENGRCTECQIREIA